LTGVVEFSDPVVTVVGFNPSDIAVADLDANGRCATFDLETFFFKNFFGLLVMI
jgi:hypothetical protein